jgi:transposase
MEGRKESSHPIICHYLKSTERPCSAKIRSGVNAVFYVAVGGWAWRMFPKESPAWQKNPPELGGYVGLYLVSEGVNEAFSSHKT